MRLDAWFTSFECICMLQREREGACACVCVCVCACVCLCMCVCFHQWFFGLFPVVKTWSNLMTLWFLVGELITYFFSGALEYKAAICMLLHQFCLRCDRMLSSCCRSPEYKAAIGSLLCALESKAIICSMLQQFCVRCGRMLSGCFRSPEYKAAIGSLLRQFKGNFRTVVIPCYVATGATGNPGELPYRWCLVSFCDVFGAAGVVLAVFIFCYCFWLSHWYCGGNS